MALSVGLNILAIIGFTLTFVQCTPTAGQWDPFQHPETHCWDRSIQIIFSCTVSGRYLKPQNHDVSYKRMPHTLHRHLGVHGYCIRRLP